MSRFTLVSHALCPYVQRAAIVLAEKGLPFERRWVDLAAKPDWFLAISPLGKTPVLLVDETPLFESAPICEYLDEVAPPPLLARDPLARARQRAWIAFGSTLLDAIAAFYNAPREDALAQRRATLGQLLQQLEQALDPQGPWFAGAGFGLVDAAFAPVFRYFDVFEALGEPELTAGLPSVRRWRAALAARPSVRDAVGPDHAERLARFLRERGSALSRALSAPPA